MSLIMSPKRRYVEVLKSICRFNDFNVRSLEWAIIQCDWCSYKKRELGHRHAQREDHHVTGVI